MRFNSFAAATLLAVGSVGVAAGIAQAQPISSDQADTSVRSTDHAVHLVVEPETNRTEAVTAMAHNGRTQAPSAQSTSAPTIRPIDEAETNARREHNAGVGALIGAGVGAVLGFFLGGVGALVTVPIGAGVGALIGFATQ